MYIQGGHWHVFVVVAGLGEGDFCFAIEHKFPRASARIVLRVLLLFDLQVILQTHVHAHIHAYTHTHTHTHAFSLSWIGVILK